MYILYIHLFFRNISWPLCSSFLNAGFWGKVMGKNSAFVASSSMLTTDAWVALKHDILLALANTNAQFLAAFSETDGAFFLRSETNTRYVSAKNRSAIFREFCGWKGPCRVVQCNFHRFARVINISKIWCSHRLIVGFRSIFGIQFLNFRIISHACREVNTFIKSTCRSNWWSGIGFELILHDDLPRSTWIEHPPSFLCGKDGGDMMLVMPSDSVVCTILQVGQRTLTNAQHWSGLCAAWQPAYQENETDLGWDSMIWYSEFRWWLSRRCVLARNLDLRGRSDSLLLANSRARGRGRSEAERSCRIILAGGFASPAGVQPRSS